MAAKIDNLTYGAYVRDTQRSTIDKINVPLSLYNIYDAAFTRKYSAFFSSVSYTLFYETLRVIRWAVGFKFFEWSIYCLYFCHVFYSNEIF